jgi:hypothetical protein
MLGYIKNIFPLGLVVLCATLICGCSNKDAWKAQPQPTKGKLMINGKPATGATVIFHADKHVDVRHTEPWGRVQEDGTFVLRSYAPGDGAPEGNYKATIVWRFNPDLPEFTDRLNSAYADVNQSQLNFTIKKGNNELPPIDLKDVKVDMGAKPKAADVPNPLKID